MKFIKDFLNSGTAKQQKRKRLGAMLVCITAAILVIALLVLAVFGIVGAIKNRNAEEESEETGDKIPKGYVTTEFSKEQSVNGTMLKITASKAYAYAGTAPTVKPEPSVREAAGVEGLYYAAYGDISLQQETMDAFHAMVKAFDATKQGSSDYTAGCLYLDSNLAPSTATLSDGTEEDNKPATKAIIKSGTIVILSATPTPKDTDNAASIYDAENKTGKGVYKWIYDNAAKYGFIVVADTAEQGNVFRYVGVAHASYMKRENLSFDDYLAKLMKTQAGKGLSVSVTGTDGKATKYEMYYVAPTEQHLVPEKFSYTVSGDNAGGYIVTVNKTAQTDK